MKIGDLAKAVQQLFGDTGTNMSMTIGAARAELEAATGV